MDEKKAPRWEEEDWVAEHPDPDKIPCKDCVYREKDREVGDTVILGAVLGMCQVYTDKPTHILFDGEDCPYHLTEEEMNEE